MRSEELWCSIAALGWIALVGCHAPGSELESVRYGPAEERATFDTFTVANINITYEDEHGVMYTEISEVRIALQYILNEISTFDTFRFNCFKSNTYFLLAIMTAGVTCGDQLN